LISYGFLTQSPRGTIGLPLTLEHYRHFFGTSLYTHVLWTTLRISLCTRAIAAPLAYPVALFMVRAGRRAARTLTIIVNAPLVISVVVRTYGWQVILGSGPNGVLNFYGPGPHLRTSALF
jgi:putative spermidine/putrescine transport system permease protein